MDDLDGFQYLPDTISCSIIVYTLKFVRFDFLLGIFGGWYRILQLHWLSVAATRLLSVAEEVNTHLICA